MYVEADIEGHGTMGKKGSISGSIIFQTFLNLIFFLAILYLFGWPSNLVQ